MALYSNTPLTVQFMQINEINETLVSSMMENLQFDNVPNIMVMASIDKVELLFLNMDPAYMDNATFKWIIATKDPNPYLCEACLAKNVLWVRPDMNMSLDDFQDFQDEVINPITIAMPDIIQNPKDKMALAFYYDLVLMANKSITYYQAVYPDYPEFVCDITEEYDNTSSTDKINLISIIQALQYRGTFGKYVMDSNKKFYQNVQSTAGNIFDDTAATRYIKTVAKWNISDGIKQTYNEMFGDFSQDTEFRIAIVVQPPFIERYLNSDDEIKYRGYCIEMIKLMAKTIGFTYTLYEVEDHKYGLLNSRGDWNGLIRDIVYGDADIALGTVRITSDIENYADVTTPFLEPVGYLILLLNAQEETGYFDFMTALTPNVWMCIVAAFFITAFFLFIFDRFCPYGKHELKKYNYTQCMWYCITSLIPQGGPDAPKNTSCKVVAATWWIFGFVIISAYTANLAAKLTLNQMQQTINNLDDLAGQTLLRYGALRGTEAEVYFRRMMETEKRFYE